MNFFSNSKERDLSDQSKYKNVEDPKILYGANSSSSNNNEDVFTEGLDSSGPREILHHCLSKLETKVMQIFDLANTTKESQIEGAGELEDLAKSVDFLTKRFDDFQVELKRKDEVINFLLEQVPKRHDNLKTVEDELHWQQWYSRKNCLLLIGIEECNHENTDDLVLIKYIKKLN